MKTAAVTSTAVAITAVTLGCAYLGPCVLAAFLSSVVNVGETAAFLWFVAWLGRGYLSHRAESRDGRNREATNRSGAGKAVAETVPPTPELRLPSSGPYDALRRQEAQGRCRAIPTSAVAAAPLRAPITFRRRL